MTLYAVTDWLSNKQWSYLSLIEIEEPELAQVNSSERETRKQARQSWKFPLPLLFLHILQLCQLGQMGLLMMLWKRGFEREASHFVSAVFHIGTHPSPYRHCPTWVWYIQGNKYHPHHHLLHACALLITFNVLGIYKCDLMLFLLTYQASYLHNDIL